MALYKDPKYITKADSGLAAFDREFKPGEQPPWSGIYRCKNCGDEIAANKGNPLPPQNHHQHPNGVSIIWNLLLFAQQKK